jgi:hypothetical protein
MQRGESRDGTRKKISRNHWILFEHAALGSAQSVSESRLLVIFFNPIDRIRIRCYMVESRFNRCRQECAWEAPTGSFKLHSKNWS